MYMWTWTNEKNNPRSSHQQRMSASFPCEKDNNSPANRAALDENKANWITCKFSSNLIFLEYQWLFKRIHARRPWWGVMTMTSMIDSCLCMIVTREPYILSWAPPMGCVNKTVTSVATVAGEWRPWELQTEWKKNSYYFVSFLVKYSFSRGRGRRC